MVPRVSQKDMHMAAARGSRPQPPRGGRRLSLRRGGERGRAAPL